MAQVTLSMPPADQLQHNFLHCELKCALARPNCIYVWNLVALGPFPLLVLLYCSELTHRIITVGSPPIRATTLKVAERSLNT